MAEGAEQEDKTEEPTQRRLDQAIEHGEVATSTEVNTVAILAAFTLALLVAAPGIAQGLLDGLKGYLSGAHTLPDDASAMEAAGRRGLWLWFQAVAVPVGLAATAGLAAGLLQHPLVFTAETLMPKFDRISPMSGVKRLMGIEAWFQVRPRGSPRSPPSGVVGAVVLCERPRPDGGLRPTGPGRVPARDPVAGPEAPLGHALRPPRDRSGRRALRALPLAKAPAHVQGGD